MGEEITKPQSSAPGRYISLVVHIWVDDDGELIRGTIEDAHTRKRLAIDIATLAALLRESLAHAPGYEGKCKMREQ